MQGVLVFSAAGERLAVSVADVLRLVVEEEIVAVPFGHPALAGVMRQADATGDVVPIFDLRGDLGTARTGTVVPRHVVGATVAVIPTSRGPIGLRLDRLLGTAARYVRADVAVPEALAGVLDGAGRADSVAAASVDVGDAPFFFFSTDAFIAAVGIDRDP
jgi:chemotaxis signal transduction protein